MTALVSTPRLIAISDAQRADTGAWLQEIESLLALALPGSVVVLLRDRELPIRERRALGERLRLLTRAHGQRLSVSDRLDLAVLLGADAVHLAETSVEVEEARAFGARYACRWWITSACHAPAALALARGDGVLLSPVVAPRKGRPALGSAGLRAAVEVREQRGTRPAELALYALGGVGPEHVPALRAAGADGVAVMGELFRRGAARPLVAALDIAR